jgi:hypothetical protein
MTLTSRLRKTILFQPNSGGTKIADDLLANEPDEHNAPPTYLDLWYKERQRAESI